MFHYTKILSIHFLVALFVTFVYSEDTDFNKEFYSACATGNMQKVQEFLTDDPSLATAPTPDGETCLHLTAISKSFEVAKLMIDLGTDVNQRVTHAKGLRMIPLSWHVYAGNHDIVKLLLDSGAEVNLVFDLDREGKKATVTDVSSLLNKNRDGPPDNFSKTHELLLSRGGKKFAELTEL